MDRLIDFVDANDAVSFKERFESILASKVSDAIEQKKVEVAQNLFNNSEISEQGFTGLKLPLQAWSKAARKPKVAAKE